MPLAGAETDSGFEQRISPPRIFTAFAYERNAGPPLWNHELRLRADILLHDDLRCALGNGSARENTGAFAVMDFEFRHYARLDFANDAKTRRIIVNINCITIHRRPIESGQVIRRARVLPQHAAERFGQRTGLRGQRTNILRDQGPGFSQCNH